MASKPTKSNIPTMSQQRPKHPMKQQQQQQQQQGTSRPTKPQEPSRESVDGNHISGQRPCDGECVSGLFALFCDDLDSEAYCPNEGSCCITSETNDNKGTTSRPHTVSVFCVKGKFCSNILWK